MLYFLYQKVWVMTVVKAISFFTGAGGLDIGMNRAGLDIRLALELEPTYCETLQINHPQMNVIQGDIMDCDKEFLYKLAGLKEYEDLDIMFGGSPCQSFSTAGNRQAFSDIRGQAMLKFADLVSEVKPKVFLLENVRGLLSAALKHRPLNQRGTDFPCLEEEEKPGSALNFLLSKFNGYDVQYKLINAADYGVPQTRERVFFVGVRKDLGVTYQFPEATHDKKGTEGKKKWVTVGEVFEKLQVEKHHYVSYTPERLKYMKMIPIGGGYWRDLPEELIPIAMGGAYKSGGGKVGFYRRIFVDRPSPTVLTSPNQKSTNLGHPFEDRPLSIEEYLAIQEFPMDYKVAGTLAQQYIQIGNAVPVRLGQVLGESIMSMIGIGNLVKA